MIQKSTLATLRTQFCIIFMNQSISLLRSRFCCSKDGILLWSSVRMVARGDLWIKYYALNFSFLKRSWFFRRENNFSILIQIWRFWTKFSKTWLFLKIAVGPPKSASQNPRQILKSVSQNPVSKFEIGLSKPLPP